MLNDSAITLFIDKNGRTKYDFHVISYNDRYIKNDDNINKEYVAYYKLDVFDNNDDNDDNANNNSVTSNSKGICTMSLNHINSYSILFNDITCSIFIIGKYSKNYCKYCYQRIIKRAYQRDDCSRTTNLTFCSMDCMNKSTYYLDTCHEIINNIYNNESHNHDNHNHEYFFMLSMNYLYNYSICSSSDERKYRSILELESHNDHHRHHHHQQHHHHTKGYNSNYNNNGNNNNNNNNCSSVDEISTVNSICLWFLQQLQQYAPKLLIKLEKHYDHLNDDSPSNKRHLNDRSLDFHSIHHHHHQQQQQQQLQQSERFYLDIIIKLFYIIKYNTQKLPLYETKDTNILCLLPNISRINHSCQPNCMLTYYSIEHTICSLKSSLIVEGGSDDVDNNTNSNKNPIIDDSTIIIDNDVNGDDNNNGNDCDINKVSSYQIMVSVVALRPIAAHEEITMSYIEPLCISYDTRQELLWNGFQFNCKCSRCKLIECSSYDIAIVNDDDCSGERDGNDIFNSIVTKSSKDNKYRSRSNSNGSNSSSSSSSNIMESDDYHLKISIDSLIERASKDGSSVSSQVSSTYLLTVLYVL